MSDAHSFWDGLSTDEANFVDAIMHEVGDQQWACPIVGEIEENGGLTRANKARFFELRLGYALHQAGIVPRYEVAGEPPSRIDFGFTSSGQEWLVELMRLEQTQAVQRATHARVDGDGVPWVERVLSSDAEDRTQSEEGETLKRCSAFAGLTSFRHQPALITSFSPIAAYSFMAETTTIKFMSVLVASTCPNIAAAIWEGVLISGVFSPRLASARSTGSCRSANKWRLVLQTESASEL